MPTNIDPQPNEIERSGVQITLEDQPAEADIRALVHNLVAYNDAHAEKEDWQRFAIFMRDGRGEIVGGLDGYTHWGWLFISHLWVAEALRGRGYGKRLVALAEGEALQRGCQHAYLDTFDFQALGFYQKLGYEVFGTLDGFTSGHTRYYLQKRALGLEISSAS
jgi:GNAT superfamily N-acetyltransferase